MKLLIKVLLIIVIPFSFNYSQKSSNAMAVVSAKLVKGLGTQTISGDLNFGDIVLSGSGSTVNKNPGEGMEIKITGHPGKNILMTFSPLEIDNYEWVSQNGGENGTLTFTPNIEQTSNNASYINAVQVISGNSYTLPNINGEGGLYIWVGGNVQINDNQPAGNYSGTFQINISY